jgi:hypothetical protein
VEGESETGNGKREKKRRRRGNLVGGGVGVKRGCIG